MGPPITSARFPPWWFERVWNMNQICVIVAAPYDTVYRWMQLVHATGLFFGEKRGREWLFDAHELYTYRVLAAFMRAGVPVGPAHIRAVVHFAFGPDGAPVIPPGKLIQSAPDAEFSVDACRIYSAVVDATNPEASDDDV